MQAGRARAAAHRAARTRTSAARPISAGPVLSSVRSRNSSAPAGRKLTTDRPTARSRTGGHISTRRTPPSRACSKTHAALVVLRQQAAPRGRPRMQPTAHIASSSSSSNSSSSSRQGPMRRRRRLQLQRRPQQQQRRQQQLRKLQQRRSAPLRRCRLWRRTARPRMASSRWITSHGTRCSSIRSPRSRISQLSSKSSSPEPHKFPV